MYFPCGRKFNYLHTCTVKPYDTLTVKIFVVMSVYGVSGVHDWEPCSGIPCRSDRCGVGLMILHTFRRYSADSRIGTEFQVRIRTDRLRACIVVFITLKKGGGYKFSKNLEATSKS